MFCPVCNTEMGKARGRYQFRECGLDFVWLDNWPLYQCPEGHATMPLLRNADRMNAQIVKQLVRLRERLGPDAMLFLREAMALKGQELAEILGCTRVEVSRWENGHSQISAIYDLRLRLEAIDRILPVSEQRDARYEVTLIFQRFFPEKVQSTDPKISVPPTPELVAELV